MPSQTDERLLCPPKPIIKPLVKKHYDMLDKLILPLNVYENFTWNKALIYQKRRTYIPIMKFLQQKLINKRKIKSLIQL